MTRTLKSMPAFPKASFNVARSDVSTPPFAAAAGAGAAVAGVIVVVLPLLAAAGAWGLYV